MIIVVDILFFFWYFNDIVMVFVICYEGYWVDWRKIYFFRLFIVKDGN